MSLGNLKSVIFDWDDTLADTSKAKLGIVKDFVEKYNLKEPSWKEIRQWYGLNVDTVIPLIFKNKEFDLQECKEHYFKLYSEKYIDTVKFTGEKVLEKLKQDYKIGIYTNEMDLMFEKLKEKFDVNVDVIVTSEDAKKVKPDPAGINLCLKKLDILPDEAVYVGDHPNDIILGKNANVKTVALVTNKFSRIDLEECNPDYIIDSLEELINFHSG